jgi:DNA-binding transcriptional MerR regulator/methylmalonyl-CoA mutase cobalamin-binding subunit
MYGVSLIMTKTGCCVKPLYMVSSGLIMYTIKEAAARTGISVQLVRAWERRYGVVQPTRSASGYRLYDEHAISRLRAMRRLVDEGWAPSTAAARVREIDDDEVRAIERAELTGARNAQRGVSAGLQLTDAFVEAAAELDERRVEQVLDEMFASGSFEQVTSRLVMPTLVALGDAWASGAVDVAAEHAAAGAIDRRLGTAFMAAGVPADADIVLVGLPPGARHDLGALAFATAARRAGLGVRHLGADLPVVDWVEAVARARARAVVIGVVIGPDVKAAISVARAIRREHADVLIAFGGRAATAIPLDDLQPAIVLPLELTDAVGALRTRLHR